jgi:hypothetical protein
MIRKKKEVTGKRIIDLTGPEGNTFYLIGTARTWAEQLNLDSDKIIDEMMEGDYENLITVFDKYFGKICILER